MIGENHQSALAASHTSLTKVVEEVNRLPYLKVMGTSITKHIKTLNMVRYISGDEIKQ
jgi:hypothetical protein